MLCDVVVVVTHAPVIHAASHFDHKKKVAWVPVSLQLHTCGPVSIIMELRLAVLQAARAPLLSLARDWSKRVT